MHEQGRLISMTVGVLLATGCGTSVGGGGGGSSTTTGLGGGVTTTYPVPATPDAAWVVNLSGGGAACNLASSVGKMGDVDATTIAQRVGDGMSGASVSCTVASAGGSFLVQAQATQNGSTLSIYVPKIDAGNVKAAPATGSVSYESPATAAVYVSDPAKPCSFYFINPSATGNGTGVGAGKIWVAFTCEGVLNGASNPPSSCPLTESYAAFENCGTAAQ